MNNKFEKIKLSLFLNIFLDIFKNSKNEITPKTNKVNNSIWLKLNIKKTNMSNMIDVFSLCLIFL